MKLLDRLLPNRRKARPVGRRLESGREPARQVSYAYLIRKAGIFVALAVITLLAFPRGERYQYAVQVGDEWRQETLTAPIDFPIYKPDDVLEAEREAIRFNTPPYFSEVTDAQDRMATNRDTVRNQLERTFDAYSSYRYNLSRDRTADATSDSLRYMEMRRNARLKLTPEQWNRLASYYDQGLAGQMQSRTQEQPLDDALLQHAWEIGTLMLNIGVMDVPLDSIYTDEIVIRDELYEQVKNKDNVFGLNEAYIFAQDSFMEEYPDDRTAANIGVAIYRSIFTPSLRYMRSATLRTWQERERRVSPITSRVNRGDVIVEKNARVTPEIKQVLVSLERERRESGGQTILWRITLGQFLLILATFLSFFLYLFLLRRTIFDENRKVLLIALLFAGIISLFAIAVRLPSVAMLGVPVAIAPILLTVMFDSRIGIFGAWTLGLIGGLMLNFDFEFVFATVFASTLGVFSVRDIKNRGQFFLSPALVGVGYLVVIGASTLIYNTPQELLLNNLVLVGLNALLVTLAYPLVWVFERTFDITTDLTLLELSDTNRPLLKELSLRAPGTFNHTLQVANLAEAAADAIGSNALLARVGALYHDVGKMLKPEYFVENQRPEENPHDQLKPRMSALIIASHVKEGLEMGRQYNLPQPVLNFIPMHHGTSRIEYFYRKAVEDNQSRPEDAALLESEFRYPGPRPNSKETGIMMLADSVEAASRSLSDPTHKRLETLVEMIFKTRIEDGQLDDTDLTFRDLDTIKDTFLSMLLGIYHVRVRYPGQEEEPTRAQQPRTPAPRPPVFPAPGPVEEEGVWGTTDQNDSRVPAPHEENVLVDEEETGRPAPHRDKNGDVKPPDDASRTASEATRQRSQAADDDASSTTGYGTSEVDPSKRADSD